MPKSRTLDDIDVRGKRVLLRADLNVPMKNGVVTDKTRIERLAPTIEALIGRGATVIVMSHSVGRRERRWRAPGRCPHLLTRRRSDGAHFPGSLPFDPGS
jgi:3-phosphoglycerate kinase